MKIELSPIGTVKSCYTSLENMPVQPIGGREHIGEIVIKDEFIDGLKDLDGFNYIYLIYYFHKVEKHNLQPIPFNDKTNTPRGVFSTRTPVHPNHIGMSLVELVSVESNIVRFRGVDILDGTPLLDIKPYIKNFDFVKDPKSGWMKSSLEDVKQKSSDDRFVF
jgi:tRNA-Thr(GGU) m(6)t(6)A37 methyltransferase TsaA